MTLQEQYEKVSGFSAIELGRGCFHPNYVAWLESQLTTLEAEVEMLRKELEIETERAALTAVYFHDGVEFRREPYPFKRAYADGQGFIDNYVSVTVLHSEIKPREYHIHCNKKF